MPHDRPAPSPPRICEGDRIVIERGARRTTIRLPRGGLTAGFALAAMAAFWSVGAGGYILFHDVVVAELRRGSQIAATSYEAQIADLKTELERSRTRRLVERAGVDERIAEIRRRQDALERRQKVVAELADPAFVGGAAAFEPAPTFADKPRPLGESEFPLDDPEDGPMRQGAAEPIDAPGGALARLEAGQDRVLGAVAARIGERRRKLESVYGAVGLTGPDDGDGRGRGGPLELVAARPASFDARAERIAADRAAVAALHRGLDRLPLRTPAPRGAALSSPFGTRLDPFLRRPAFHAGLDFEAQTGEAVRATASGRVTNASYSGGYGLMVEIDHGAGLSNRFGHLSSTSVMEGEGIAAGTIIGRVGSTGRSTGSHLHYETRVDGEAVDPMRYLRAGRIVATLD